MEIKTQGNQQKPYEEAEIEIFQFGEDVITTSELCLVSGTKIVMADGSNKNIENIKNGDIVLSFDHEAGKLVGREIIFVYKGDEPKCYFTLCFGNGLELSIVGEHDLFEKESNKYVCIREENAKGFIGKHYYCVDSKSYVELIDVKYSCDKADFYEIYAAKSLNVVANGMLNVADDVDYLLNIYEFDKNLKANPKTLEEDIQKYGLFELVEEDVLTKEEYEGFNSRYLNIAVGKGYITIDDARKQNEIYRKEKC